MKAIELLKELKRLSKDELKLEIIADTDKNSGEINHVGLFPDFVILES